METTIKSITATVSIESVRIRPARPLYVRMLPKFFLLWLDENIDDINNDIYRNNIIKLRQVVDTVNTFTDVNACINFFTNIKEEKTFLIVSGTLSQIVIPIVHDISQIRLVYIFGENESHHEQWAQQWSKVKGVFADITPICEALEQAVHECDKNMLSISFVKTTDGVLNKNLDQLNQSFMYTQILKEILLTIDFKQTHIDKFLTYCRKQFNYNSIELQNVEKLCREYPHPQPIWWYTYNCFLYSMLNRALRIMEVDLIINMGFFIRDLHSDIVTLHSKQYSGHHHSNSFTVFRGQGLSPTAFDELIKTKGGLMSFNYFLSTSLDRAVSLAFAESNQYNTDLIGVLFEITINPSISSTAFANISDVSYYQGEKEILFSMHSVFRIGQIKQIGGDDCLWQVELTLTNDNDSHLNSLIESIREETFPNEEGWSRLGRLLLKLGHFNKAEELYEILLQQATDNGEKAHLYHMLGVAKNYQEKHVEAIEFYEKSIEIKQNILFPIQSDLATSYNNIGSVYDNMGKYSEALLYYQKGLVIKQKTLFSNHPSLATSYNNIGLVYDNMGNNSKAISYYEMALEIYQKTLPLNHPKFATSYNNIGSVYENMGDYSKALSYYEKDFEICQKTLPPNHPNLATSYNNISLVYKKMGQYSKAVSSYEKALEIKQKTLPSNHPNLITSYNNIGNIYNSMGEYSKALISYEKALEIKEKRLSPNHPHLATSYNNIGLAYDNMGEKSKALSYYEKALEIYQITLPSNHSSLATSYNNIGLIYDSMGEYSKALSYYEKDFEICQKSLHPKHPELATSYNNIGNVYSKLEEYSKALSFYECALDILQHSVTENHPNLLTLKESIEYVKKKL